MVRTPQNTFRSPFSDSGSNSSNHTQLTTPLPNITTPPVDGEGMPFTKNINGKFIPPTTNKQPEVTPEQLNDITNNGLDTEPIYDKDINDLLGNQSPNSLGSQPKMSATIKDSTDGSAPNMPGSPNSNIQDLNSVVTDQTRLVGQQFWNYRVCFYNHQQEKYELRAHGIKQLVIEDDLLTWPLRGYIIVDDKQEGFERSYTNNYYHIRSDARDEIELEIWPTTKDGELSDDIWKIKTICIIYDVEDMPSQNMTNKSKKLYFWDKKFQFLLEQNCQWSTATGTRIWSPPPPDPIEHATDEEKEMFTGEAIASILIDSGFGDIVDQEKWDKGFSKINTTTCADLTIWENIRDLLITHISEEKDDNCVLQWNRADRKLNLIPYYKLFEKAGKDSDSPGELQREHFFFEEISPSKQENTETSPFKAPYLHDNSTKVDIKVENYNTIMNYRFMQTSGLDNSQAFTTRPVHSYWKRKKQFDIDVKENEIETVKKDNFLKNYVTNLLGNDYPVFVLNRTKKEQISIHPVFSEIDYGPKNEEKRKLRSLLGRGNILYAGIFLNQCLVIRVQGSTHRMAGTFVGVDRLRQSSDTDYDWAVCGQYLVVNVKHIIQQQKYINELTLVKIHAYKALQNNEEVY